MFFTTPATKIGRPPIITIVLFFPQKPRNILFSLFCFVIKNRKFSIEKNVENSMETGKINVIVFSFRIQKHTKWTRAKRTRFWPK